ncbi:MAG: M23 family metallopeptidase, partial [Verrucomicrobiaceae bacterium]
RRIELRPVESNDRQIVLVVRDPRDRVTAGMSGAPIMMGGGRVVGILLQGTGDRIDKSRLIAVRSDYIGRVLGGRIPMAPIRAVAVSAVAIGENSTASMDLPEPTPEETRAPARTIDPNAAIDSDLADSEAPTAESLANEALSKIPLGGFEWPVEGKVVRKFGPGPSGERNDGIKIAVAVNTPVVASADGVVAYVGGDVPALGLIVILSHGNGFTTVYGQLGRLVVARGQSVKKGQTLGLSGRSPLSDAAQIHFETRSGRTPVDPMRVLDAKGGVK